MDRITAIRASLSGFVSGMIGLMPFIGLVPAVYALYCWFRVRRHYDDWNPASAYLEWGARLGLLGLVISALATFILLLISVYR
jgi:hypothetical protein